MTKKVSRVLRSMLLVLMSLIFLAGGDFILPAGNVSAYAAQVMERNPLCKEMCCQADKQMRLTSDFFT